VPQHLPSVLAQVVDAVNSVEQKAGGTVAIKLHCEDVSRDVEEVIADPFFRRVLFSLLSNAVKFSPSNGIVDVTVSYIPTLNASSSSHRDKENNVAWSTSSATRRPDVNMFSFFSSRSRIPGRLPPVPAVEEGDGSFEVTEFPPRGTFTFHIRNSTSIAMNTSHVRNFFKYYYHPDSSLSGDCSHVDMNGCTADRATAATTAVDPAPFAAASTSNTSFNDLHQYSGLGLGLYTAYNMVTLMGGTLDCSVENGNEACFWFTIPSTSASSLSLQSTTSKSSDVFLEPSASSLSLDFLKAAADQPANGCRLFHTTESIEPFPSFAFLTEQGQRTPPYSPLSNGTSVSSGKSECPSEIRVLVVDDSRICQKVALRALTGLEFVVDLAGNGLEACRMLAERPLRFDIVLMDLRMPVMDGLTAIRRCRAELGLTKLPIVTLTAEVGASIRDEAMNAGANWFLTKPAKSQLLVSVLRTMTAASDQPTDNSCDVA
jgi:CheY-like chemotaxis protein